MEIKPPYIPASELGDVDHQRLIWHVPLPEYAPAEDILVNVNRLNRLAYLSGMESLRVGGYAGDTTQVTPEIDSADKQGSATATLKGSVSKAETFKADVDAFNDAGLPYEYQWTRGKVSLNISEIDEKVGEKSNLRDPNQWSKQIDRALRAGVRESSWESLIANSPGKFTPPALLSASILGGAVLGQEGTELLGSSLRTYALAALIFRHPLFKCFGIKNEFKDMKHSLLPGFPIDRYLAVNAMSRALPLVKAKTINKNNSKSDPLG